jgi:site-specific recombinase XerD
VTNSPTDLFEQFIREKQYISGVTPKTIRTYRDAWKAFQRYRGEVSASGVKTFVVTAGESGVSAGAVNTFARAVNSFLTWLHREGHIAEHLKIPKVKQPKRIIPTHTADDVHRILSHKARNVTETRLLTILALLVTRTFPLRSKIVPRCAGMGMTRMRLALARWAKPWLLITCRYHSRAIRAANITIAR